MAHGLEYLAHTRPMQNFIVIAALPCPNSNTQRPAAAKARHVEKSGGRIAAARFNLASYASVFGAALAAPWMFLRDTNSSVLETRKQHSTLCGLNTGLP